MYNKDAAHLGGHPLLGLIRPVMPDVAAEMVVVTAKCAMSRP